MNALNKKPVRPGQRIVWDWLDSVGATTKAAAEAAGIYQHGTTIGNIREFAAKKFFRQFLPNSVSVGTGQIFSLEGRRSKQIDIVIADSTYPELRNDADVSLYPVESVIAAIEIKSKLDKGELYKALSNCQSVYDVGISILNAPLMAEANRVSWYNPDSNKVRQQIVDALCPRTYVVGLTGYTTPDSLRDSVKDWFETQVQDWKTKDHNSGGEFPPPTLPSMVTTDSLIGLNPARLPITTGPQTNEKGKQVDPLTSELAFTASTSDKHLSFVACDILAAIRDKAQSSTSVFYGVDSTKYFSLADLVTHELSTAGSSGFYLERVPIE